MQVRSPSRLEFAQARGSIGLAPICQVINIQPHDLPSVASRVVSQYLFQHPFSFLAKVLRFLFEVKLQNFVHVPHTRFLLFADIDNLGHDVDCLVFLPVHMFDVGKFEQVLGTEVDYIFGRDLFENIECSSIDAHVVVEAEEFQFYLEFLLFRGFPFQPFLQEEYGLELFLFLFLD